MGAKIAVDDFDSGYANFHPLGRVDTDYFKIDASLIRNIHRDADTRLLVEGIVRFARKIGVQTVAQYIVAGEIEKVCRAIGIDWLRGYRVGRPAP